MAENAKNLIIPEGYHATLNLKDTEVAIKLIKDTFEKGLAEALNLTRVSAPLFVQRDTGLNDNLNGVERPVSFEAPYAAAGTIEIVHSLAKWKRMALKRYGFAAGEGLYTDMNAIRRDEEVDNLHSIYVDQWDWEIVITKEQRNIDFLKKIVRDIYRVIRNTAAAVSAEYPAAESRLPDDIYFVSTLELEERYPALSPKEREDEISREKGAVFVMQIGGPLKSGDKHDGRAPDYDDWSLNGDIVLWYPLLSRAFEVSSMGIRVDSESLEKQLTAAGCTERKEFDFHKSLLNGSLPLTMGGGLGQSRLCMFFLNRAHIGEVQSSLWPDDMLADCERAGIIIL